MWHMAAYQNSNGEALADGTYEVIGPHFRNNPHGLEEDILVKYGEHVLEGCSFSIHFYGTKTLSECE